MDNIRWGALNSINLTEFYHATAMPYDILECTLRVRFNVW